MMQMHIKSEQNDSYLLEKPQEVPEVGQNGSFPTQVQIQGLTQNRPPPPLMAATPVAAINSQQAQISSHGQMKVQVQGNQHDILKPKISESQIDYSSCKGMFGWTTIDGVNVPYIFRKDRKFVSVRIVEQKLLSRYPNSYPDELGKHQPLTSFFVTEHEVKLLNEINLVHCGGEFGTKQFNIKDLIVLLEDFEEFYNLVKKTFPENMMNEPPQHQINKALTHPKLSQNQRGCGWIQVNNTVTPYVKRINDKYVPLSVMKYAASLNVMDKGELPEFEECELLNKACQEAGFNFTFSKSTRIVSLTDIMKQCQVHVIDLPSENPLEYAQYLEFQQSPNSEQHNLPNYGQDMLQNSQCVPENIKPPPMPQDPNRYPPPRRGVHPAFMDPRFIFSYNRFPFHMYSYGPPNVTVHPSMAGSFGQMGAPPSQYTQNGQIMNGQQRSPIPNGNSQNLNLPVRTSSAGSTGSGGINPQRSPGGGSGTPQWCEQSAQPNSQNPQNFSQLRGFQQQGPSFVPQGNYQPRHVLQGPATQQTVVRNARSDIRQQGPHRQSMPPPYPYSQMSPNTPSYYPPPPRNRIPHTNMQQSSVKNDAPLNGGNPPPPHMSGPFPSRRPTATQNPRISAPITQTTHNTRSVLTTPSGNVSSHAFVPNSVSTENQRQINCNSQIPGTSVPKHKIADCTDKSKEQLSIPVIEQVNITKCTTNSINNKLGSKSETVSLTDCIKGVWLGGKSISCMHMDRPQRTGKFCLVEAVCKLYFNGCSVNEFLFALENVLKVPLVTCTDEEEKAFIQYYSLPVTVLKCNKMINFDDLGKYFPQLSYVFRGKTGVNEPQKTGSQNHISDDSSHQTASSEASDTANVMMVPLSVSESQNVNHKRTASSSPSGVPQKQPCRRLEETVQRLLNQQGTSGTSEQVGGQQNTGTSSVIVLD